jgi:putative ABC transport system ATP-binding protein
MLNNNEKSNGRSVESGDRTKPISKNPQDTSLIHLSSLVKTYNTASGGIPALNNIDLEIHPGEFVAITGKSGAGKTTLINMIAGVDQITSGEVWVDEMPLHQMRENQLALWRGRNMGVIYQSFHLMPNLSILDNVKGYGSADPG